MNISNCFKHYTVLNKDTNALIKISQYNESYNNIVCYHCGKSMICVKNNITHRREFIHQNEPDNVCIVKYDYIYRLCRGLLSTLKLNIDLNIDIYRGSYNNICLIESPYLATNETPNMIYIYKMNNYKAYEKLVTDNLYVFMSLGEEFTRSIKDNEFYKKPNGMLYFDIHTHMLEYVGPSLRDDIIVCRMIDKYDFVRRHYFIDIPVKKPTVTKKQYLYSNDSFYEKYLKEIGYKYINYDHDTKTITSKGHNINKELRGAFKHKNLNNVLKTYSFFALHCIQIIGTVIWHILTGKPMFVMK